MNTLSKSFFSIFYIIKNQLLDVMTSIFCSILADSRSTVRNGMDALKKSNATRSLEAENRRQAQTLFGVVALFALSHVFRVVLNVHEIYLTSFNRELGPGCASNIPFWTHVRNFYFY